MNRKLRKAITAAIAILLVLLMSGCSGGSYVMSGTGNKMNIKINATDGKYGEGFVMDISKNEKIHIESELEKGEIQIDFMEAINTATADDTDNWITTDLITSITVGPGDSLDVEFDFHGDFMPTLTAIGETSGKLVITIVKK